MNLLFGQFLYIMSHEGEFEAQNKQSFFVFLMFLFFLWFFCLSANVMSAKELVCMLIIFIGLYFNVNLLGFKDQVSTTPNCNTSGCHVNVNGQRLFSFLKKIEILIFL